MVSNCGSKIGYFGNIFVISFVPSVEMQGYYLETATVFLCPSFLHFLLYIIYDVRLVWLNAARRRIVIGNYDLKVNDKLMWDVMRHRWVVGYRRFVAACRPRLQGRCILLGLLYP